MGQKPLLKIGILGDTHCGIVKKGNPSYGFYTRSSENLKISLEYLSSIDVEVVTFAGDLIDMAKKRHANHFHKIIDKAFLGKKTKMVYTIGNHEFWTNAPSFALPIDKATEFFKEHTGQNVNSHQKIKGYHFITLAPDTDNLSYKNNVAWLRRELKKASKDSENKPIFLLTHGRSMDDNHPAVRQNPNFRHDNRFASKEMYAELKNYPNVVNLMGHTHASILEEDSILQNTFTTIDCGCTAYSTPPHPYKDGLSFVPMGLVAEVYLDKVIFKRIRFTDGVEVKAPWVLDLPVNPNEFRYRKERFSSPKPIEFKSKEIEIENVDGENYLVFANASGEDYIEGYLVEITDSNGQKIVEERVLNYYLDGLDKIEEKVKVKLNLEKGKYRVKITGKYSYSAHIGESLESDIEV